MPGLILGALLLLLLYAMGRFVYRKTWGRWAFIKVLANFAVMLFISALILGLLFSLGSLILGLAIGLFSEQLGLNPEDLLPLGQQAGAAPSWNIGTKVPAGLFLVFLLLLILAVALLMVLIRRPLLRRFPRLQLTEEEYEISEYFIQWITIYVVVYQLLFDALKSLGSLLPQLANWKEAFNVLLSPENVNAVIQPLLIASWIAIVLEKLAGREAARRMPGADSGAQPGASGANGKTLEKQ